jgi:LacI family transcriptional regulator
MTVDDVMVADHSRFAHRPLIIRLGVSLAKTQRILLLVEPSTSYGRKVLRGLGSFAHMRKNWVFEFDLLATIDDMLDRGLAHADGIVIRGAQQDWVQRVVRSGIPAVNVSAERSTFELPTVISDNRAIGALAADHLLSRGFKRFAAGGFADRANFNDRIAEFSHRVQQKGFPCQVLPQDRRPPETVVSPPQAEDLADWLRHLPRPIGLLAANDEFGRIIIDTCRNLEVRVPEDVAVVGVDNDEVICELSSPSLSSIDHGAERVGYSAAKLLSRLMAGGKAANRPMLIKPVGVVTRRSSDTLPIEDALVADCTRYIWDHVEQGLDVDDLVKRAGVSRRWLEVCFRRELGRPPAVEIRRAQVERAMKAPGPDRYAYARCCRRFGFQRRKAADRGISTRSGSDTQPVPQGVPSDVSSGRRWATVGRLINIQRQRAIICAEQFLLRATMNNKQHEDLNWLLSRLPQSKDFIDWLARTGELPPDFDLLPSIPFAQDPLQVGSRRIASPDDWPARRAEIASLVERWLVGHAPPPPENLHANIEERSQVEWP